MYTIIVYRPSSEHNVSDFGFDFTDELEDAVDFLTSFCYRNLLIPHDHPLYEFYIFWDGELDNAECAEEVENEAINRAAKRLGECRAINPDAEQIAADTREFYRLKLKLGL